MRARARRAKMPIPNLKSLIRELQEAQVAAPETQQKQASTVLIDLYAVSAPFLRSAPQARAGRRSGAEAPRPTSPRRSPGNRPPVYHRAKHPLELLPPEEEGLYP